MVSIYTLSDPLTKEVRYVGKTSGKPSSRFSQHLYQWKRCTGKISHVNAWIKSLANKNLKPVQEVIDIVDEVYWIEAEQGYIRLFKSYGCKLTNLTHGGEGTSGYKATKSSIEKRLASCRQSDSWKEKNRRHSDIMKTLHAEKVISFGTSHLPDEKRKMIGKKHSEKLKQRYLTNPDGIANMIKARSVPVNLINEHGETLLSFCSVSEAGRFFNIAPTNITRVCKGKAIYTNGLRFKYDKPKKKD